MLTRPQTFTRACLPFALLLAAGALAPVSSGAGIEVIYTKILGQPTAAIPGPTDLNGAAAFSEWKGLESLVMAPGTSRWMIKGRTNLGSDLEHMVVTGTGRTGTRLVQEGMFAPGGGANERFEFFGSSSSNVNPFGRFDDLGRLGFSARIRAAATGSADAPNGQRVLMWDGSTFTVIHRQNEAYTGVFDLAAQPGGGDPGNEFVSNTIGSVHLLNNGTVGSCDSQIGGVAFTMRPANFYNREMFHQSGGNDTVVDLAGTGTATFTFSTGVPIDRFNTTPDGAHWMMVGTINGSPSRNVLVRDGRVIIQNGSPPAPGVANTGTVTNFTLLSNGSWFAWGTFAGGPGFWAVKDGVLVARTGDPITAGSTELWGSTVYMLTGNLQGDWAIAGSTNAAAATNEVLIGNGTTVVAREGAMIDLNNNGSDDDNAFIGRGNLTGSAFINLCIGVGEDRSVYYFANIHDSSGADLQSPSFFGDPNAFLRSRLVPPCVADFNGDGNRDPDDLSDFITCFFLELMAPGTCPDADFDGSGQVDPDDLADFTTIFFITAC